MRNCWCLVLAFVFATSCGKKDSAQESSPSQGAATTVPTGPSPTEEARTIFQSVCATCHGQDGLGDGPGAAALNPKPRNYTDKAWQASVTDDQIKQTILMGGAAVGKSPAMPAQPQLKEKPEVVEALVRIIRTFGK